MWYGSGSDGNLSLATSMDGTNWADQGEVQGSGNYIFYHAQVLYNANGFGNATGYKYKIWFWNYSNSPYSINSIEYAESNDGMHWVNVQNITQNSTNFLVDPASVSTGCGSPFCGSYGPETVMYNSSAINSGTNPFGYTYVMYYDVYTGTPTEESIGLAYSVNGKNWTRYGTAPVLSASGIAGEWDSQYATMASVVHVGNIFNMWYSGGVSADLEGIGHATSTDGINWIKDSTNPLYSIFDGVQYQNVRAYTPSVLYENNTYKMWYSCVGNDTAYGGDASETLPYAMPPRNRQRL